VRELQTALPTVVQERGPDLVALQLDVLVVGETEPQRGGAEHAEGLGSATPNVESPLLEVDPNVALLVLAALLTFLVGVASGHTVERVEASHRSAEVAGATHESRSEPRTLALDRAVRQRPECLCFAFSVSVLLLLGSADSRRLGEARDADVTGLTEGVLGADREGSSPDP
jgi:hypothetical protein